jgi:hypothetical protein
MFSQMFWLSSLIVMLGIAPAARAEPASGQASSSPAVYAAPGGSDSNSGRDMTRPVRSLERARDIARTSANKTIYLAGGVYSRHQPLALGLGDSGESWLASPGQIAVIDGEGKALRGIEVKSATNVTIRWLTFQNFLQAALFVERSPGVTLDSNVIQEIYCDGWNQGGIVTIGDFHGGRITHNRISHSRYAGILTATTGHGDLEGVEVAFNAIYDTCESVADCGAIYAVDRSHSNRTLFIHNNVIADYGSFWMSSKGIYLDDLLSHVRVERNIVYGNGRVAVQIHGGDNNLIVNNVFDVRGATGAVLYEKRSVGMNMDSNRFACNIIYFSRRQKPSLWRLVGGGIAPIEQDDIYWAAPESGGIASGAPSQRLTSYQSDFVDANAHNYMMKSAVARTYCGFQQITIDQVGPLPNH